jgi:hypothetical protein
MVGQPSAPIVNLNGIREQEGNWKGSKDEHVDNMNAFVDFSQACVQA